MPANEMDHVLGEQQLYYSLRAAEYDDAYDCRGQHDRGPERNAEFRDVMATVQRAFDDVPLAGDIIELAAGTGAWTERLVGRARSLTVLDASREMLEQNRRRLGPAAADVTYRVVDLFAWRPERQWEACVFGFWLAKVPDERVEDFLQNVARAVRPNGVVCCVDKFAEAEPPTELERRQLNDGREFTIIDHPRTPNRIITLFRAAGIDVQVQTFGQRFCLAAGTKGANA